MSEPDEFEWPQADYSVPDFCLRPSFDYLEPVPFDPPIVTRMQQAFGDGNRDALVAALNEAREVMEGAIESSRSDAYLAWLKHDVWLPTLGDSYKISERPAQLLTECIGVVGTRECTEQQVCAAVALWCYGEHFGTVLNGKHETEMLEQAALALAEAEFYRGMDAQTARMAVVRSVRNKAAADKGHEANKIRKLHGFEIWDSRRWQVQADAEREIAKQCNITQPVAGRWIRDYKHTPDAYRAELSKHSALQRL